MEARAAFEARSEALVFLEFFADFPDPRQPGKVIYPLQEVFLLCLLAVLAGAETVVDIARFGQKKIELLRRFLPFRDGTPSHDQLGDILATLDATQFQRRFVAWVAKLIGVSADVIAIDGKTVRCSSRAAYRRSRNIAYGSRRVLASDRRRRAAGSPGGPLESRCAMASCPDRARP